MKYVRSLLFSFSMFSRLPVPTLKWHDDNMRYMLAFFPVVGAVVGLIIWGWLALCAALGFGVFLRAAGLTLLPVAVTGGIHLDGFCDTTDALASRAEPERKREILKDPHTGAFAVIGVASYLILYFALTAELDVRAYTPFLLLFMFILCRSLSGLAVMLFNSGTAKGLASSFKASADKTVSLILLGVFFLAGAAGLIAADAVIGAVMTVLALLVFGYLYLMAKRQFHAMSGDLAGWFLQVCELVMLAGLVFMTKAVG